jgi:hypothetical protein
MILTSNLPPSFDNSGHKMPYPQWQSNATNVNRSNRILNLIASEFSDNPHVVSIIAPLNEFVFLVWSAIISC